MKFIFKIINKLIILSLIAMMLLGYAMFLEPNLLRINKFELGTLSSAKIRVVQFSDTHIGEYYSIRDLQKLANVINMQNPDIIVFTGDLVDETTEDTDFEAISKTLGSMKAKLGKFAIYGNHDYGAQGHKYYKKMMQNGGFKVLVNDAFQYHLTNTVSVNILGLDDSLLGKPDYETIDFLIKKRYYDILLLHEPDEVDKFSDEPYELALAGHTHGGQVRIPFKGALKKAPLGEKYEKGFYDISEEQKLYVSSGVGSTIMPFRFLNIPEIVVFDINL